MNKFKSNLGLATLSVILLHSFPVYSAESEGIKNCRIMLGGAVLENPFWVKILDAAKLTKIGYVKKLISKSRNSFKVIGFDQLPDNKTPVLAGFKRSQLDSDLAHAFDRKSAENSKILDEADALSRKTYGDLKLTDVFLNPYTLDLIKKDASLAVNDDPYMLGELSSGQPVMVVLLSTSHTRVEIPTVSQGQDSIISNAFFASQLKVGGQVYGIQKLNDQVSGLIVELLPRGAPMQFGGDKYFTIDSFKEVTQLIIQLTNLGSDPKGLDLRLYVTESGQIRTYPNLYGKLKSDFSFYALSGHDVEKLKDMGISADARSLDPSIKDANMARALIEYLQKMTSKSNAQAEATFDWLFQNHNSIYLNLLSEAVRTISYEKESKSTSDQYYKWAHILQTHAAKRNLHLAQAAGPLLPVVQNKEARSYAPLKPNDFVAMKLTSAVERQWNRTSEIGLNVQVIGQLSSIQINSKSERSYKFKINWRSDKGAVNETILLTENELKLLGAFTFDARESGRILDLFKKQKAESVDHYEPLVEIRDFKQDVVEKAKSNSDRRQLSPSFRSANDSEIVLQEHSSARELVNRTFGDTNKVKSAYHSLNKKHLILVDEKGNLEVREFAKPEKTLYKIKTASNSYNTRAVVFVGKNYFVTKEPNSGRTEYAIRNIQDGKELDRTSPDGFVTVITDPAETIIHIVNLAYPSSFLLPSGASRYGKIKAQNPADIQKLDGLWKSTHQISEFLKTSASHYFSAAHISADGKRAYLAVDHGGGNSQVAVIRLSDFQILGVTNSGIKEVTAIHSTQDGQILVFEGENQEQKVFKAEP